MSNLAVALMALSAASGSHLPSCQTVQKPADHWGQFQSKFTSGPITVGVRRGYNQCTFRRVDAGTCILIDPGQFFVQIDGQEQWLNVPADTVARLTFEGNVVTCRFHNRIRTD